MKKQDQIGTKPNKQLARQAEGKAEKEPIEYDQLWTKLDSIQYQKSILCTKLNPKSLPFSVAVYFRFFTNADMLLLI